MTGGDCSVVVAGIGGQGVLRFARLLGNAAALAGAQVRVGQIYGLSQRGGSVEATVRIGSGSTAFISTGEADVVVGFEPLETERALPRMNSTTTVVANRIPILPPNPGSGGIPYPAVDSMFARIRELAGRVYQVDGTALTTRVGDKRFLNVVMLGVLAGVGVLPFDAEFVSSAVGQVGGETAPQLGAFQVGLAAGVTLQQGSADGVPANHRALSQNRLDEVTSS